MPITSVEAVDIGTDAYEVVLFLQKALKVDEDGKKRLDKAEMVVLLKMLAPLAAKITRDIFSGTNDKRVNAAIFLENLEKLSNKQQNQNDDLRQMLAKALVDGPVMTGANSVETRGDADSLSVDNSSSNFKIDVGSFKEMTLNKAFFSESDLNNDDLTTTSEKVINKEEVLINMSPKKYEQAKDQLFIDFLKMYTKRSLKDLENNSDRDRQSANQIRLVAEKALK